jgi:DNA-directed RNA polymerase sigma subunit (sigma70/sigma32)
MSDDESKSIKIIRKGSHTVPAALSVLSSLTPQEAEALRARFGIDGTDRVPDEEEGTQRALARELAMLKKKKKL